MKRPLVFRELRIRRMPGFPGGGPALEGLSAGINLVHGPNASGKTTTALAFQSLLWARAAPESAGLEGRFDLGRHGWRVEVEAGRPSWQQDGQDAPAPPLPPADDRDRYLLSLHGLLRDDDRSLAERIRVETAGGYDLRTAAASLRFGAGGRPTTLVGRLTEARAALVEAREREAELRDDAAEVEGLRQRRLDLVRDAARLEPLRLALDLARAREAAAAAGRAVGAFPPGVGLLRGDELERIAEWEQARGVCERAIAEATAAASHASAEIERAGLGDIEVPGSLLVELEARLDSLRRLDDDLARARDAHAEARGRRQHVGEALGIDRLAEPDAPTGDDMDRLDRLVRRTGELRERRAALDERIRLLGGVAGAAPGTAPAGDIADGIRALRRWLRAGTDEAVADRRLRALLVVATAGLAAAGLVAAALGGPVLTAAGVGLVLLAAALLILRPGRDRDERAAAEREASRLGHAPPHWTSDAVERALDALEQRAATERLAGERRLEANRLAGQHASLEAEEKALGAERAALATALGLAPSAGDLVLYIVATRLRDWEQARSAEASARMLLYEVGSRRESLLEAAARGVAPHGYEVVDPDSLAGALKDLRDRRERHQAATAALAAARARVKRAEDERAGLAAKRVVLLDRLGLGEDQEHVLRGWAGLLHEYQAARADLEVAERGRVAAEAALSGLGSGAVEPDLVGAPVAELAAELASVEAAVAEERELAEQIARIESRLEAARQKHDVEAALAAVEEAESELAARRDEDVEAEVGRRLVDWLAERSADYSRPAVFHRARDLFGRITRGRYQLDMEDGDVSGFRAYDNTTHRGHALDELSSGTRLQLLLAVRLAFVETQETGAALPLLLDEVLANCDDDRATAIIDAALAIARDGRQIFYFTAQADELAKWTARLKEQDEVDWCVRGILDGVTARQLEIEWTAAARPAVPAPDGMDHAAYGRALRVSRFDPWAEGVGGLHLWYLVDDVNALHQLLDLGVSTWGQLDYLDSVVGDGALPGGMRDVVDAARLAAERCDRFRQLWRQGRGRLVDRAALARSGAVSDTFMDPIAELCDELDGQGEALVEALADRRVPRFQVGKVEELRAFLQAHGYMTDEEPLTVEQILILLTAEAGGVPGDEKLVERLLNGP